jgi:hypothetical protein
MNKKALRSFNDRIKLFSPWYLLALALIFGAISVYSLRQNNLTMVRLRDQVFAVDKAGGNVEKALKELREHIYAHMNTNLSSGSNVKPPIQLKYTYDRLMQAQNKTVSTEQIYTDAQKHCEALYPGSFSGGPRVPCIQQYVASHSQAPQKTIPDSLYKFDFVSPTWTPDLAGWSMLISALFFVLFALRMALDMWLKRELHNQL